MELLFSVLDEGSVTYRILDGTANRDHNVQNRSFASSLYVKIGADVCTLFANENVGNRILQLLNDKLMIPISYHIIISCISSY
jgi:hypothetical protein